MERCGLDRLEEMKEYLGQEKEQLLMQRMEEAGRRFGDKGCGCKAVLDFVDGNPSRKSPTVSAIA